MIVVLVFFELDVRNVGKDFVMHLQHIHQKYLGKLFRNISVLNYRILSDN